MDLSEDLLAGPNMDKVIKGRLEPQLLKELLDLGVEIQERLTEIDTDSKLSVMSELAERWRHALDAGELDYLINILSKKTGYCEKMIKMDLDYVITVLDPDSISISLEQSLPGGIESLDAFIEIESGEMYKCMPAGPVLILGSGNSVIPCFISGILSLMTNNFTLIRPSSANSEAVFALFKMLKEMALEETPIAEIARELSNASLIFCASDESETLKYLLEEAPLGVVNFWGDKITISKITKAISMNSHHPRCCFLAPMTGYAVIHHGVNLEEAAHALAEAIVYYDQQLCSSPTEASFIGGFDAAKEFADELGRALEELTKDFPIEKSEYEANLVQRARNKLRMSGSYVIVPLDGGPAWTVAVSNRQSNLDRVFPSIKEFKLEVRRRFIEIIAVESERDVIERLKSLKEKEPFSSIMGIQSVGLAVPDTVFEVITPILTEAGVHRIVPIRDMHLRSPIEPFDGKHMAREFINILYVRKE
ncbi:MAG: hypothetical protein DRO00_00595 [Thermoproteota archaeon]|nr:MAG: hypothetical protein DRO00_00595 [Candidatus Korarchaeota archaeon]